MGRKFSRDSGIYVVVVVVVLLLLLSPPHSSFTCFRSFAYGVSLAGLAL